MTRTDLFRSIDLLLQTVALLAGVYYLVNL